MSFLAGWLTWRLLATLILGCREWDEARRMEFLVQELNGKRPLLPPDLPMSAEVSWHR